jgi:hypothetical protein
MAVEYTYLQSRHLMQALLGGSFSATRLGVENLSAAEAPAS